MFPPGRQLPHLTCLDIDFVQDPSGDYAAAPDSSLLVSCCPGLKHLGIVRLTHSAAALLQLTGLKQLSHLDYEEETYLGTRVGQEQSVWGAFQGSVQRFCARA